MIRNYKSEDYKQLIELLKSGDMFDERADKKDLLEEKITNQPGSIIVYEKEGDIVVSALKPTVAFSMVDNKKLEPLAKEVEDILKKVIDEL